MKKTLGAFRRPFKLAAAFKPRGIGQKTLCTVGNASAGKRVAREREGKNGAGRNREQARELEAGPTNRPHDSRGGATSRASASLASRGAPVAPPPPASPAAAPPASRRRSRRASGRRPRRASSLPPPRLPPAAAPGLPPLAAMERLSRWERGRGRGRKPRPRSDPEKGKREGERRGVERRRDSGFRARG